MERLRELLERVYQSEQDRLLEPTVYTNLLTELVERILVLEARVRIND